jgi:acetolactate synthase-1/2/3 large subunit
LPDLDVSGSLLKSVPALAAATDAMTIYELPGIISARIVARLPATIAVKFALPQRQVVGIVGDGAFLMTGLESVTAASNDIGAVWFVFNDGELAQIAQAQEIPYQRTACTDIGKLNHEAFAAAVGAEYVDIANDAGLADGISAALAASAGNKPVLVNVHIDYSKKTQFTVGTVQTNLKRFDTKNKLRIVGRALKRKFFGT